MNTVYALLPAYNEEQNIEDLIKEWLKYEEILKNKFNLKLVILPIDDKSTDNTKEILTRLSNGNNIKPIYHKQNMNLGGVLSTGFKYFMENGETEDLIFVMDADNTHNPKYCIEMIEKLYNNSLDCVIASRYCENSEVVGVPSHRNFLSNGARFYYNMVLKIPNVNDYTCGYRVYTYGILKEAYDKFGDDFIQETGFSCMMEIIYKLHLINAKIGETGFVLRYDNKLGESKMKIVKTIKQSLITALKLHHRYKKIKV